MLILYLNEHLDKTIRQCRVIALGDANNYEIVDLFQFVERYSLSGNIEL